MKNLILKNLEKIKGVEAGSNVRNKPGALNQQEQEVDELADRFEEARQIADKTFDIVEGQLNKLENYIENDINEK